MSVIEEGVDTIVYAGEINRDGYEELTNVCETSKTQYKKANLILYTYGGDPHSAFRIARALQHHYSEGVTLFIPHYCKSAGTLIAIGAKELVISDMGELGPLDVQLVKTSEMFERSSGMDIAQGIEALRVQALETFKNFSVEIKIGSKLSTKIATEVATEMTAGLFGPVFAQIDPTRMGEIQRATHIAFKYGKILERKWRNIKDNGVSKLIADYPSHAFVIDRKEARDIFKEVRAPDQAEVELLKKVDAIMRNLLEAHNVTCFLWEFPSKQEPSHEAESNESDESTDVTQHPEAKPDESSESGNPSRASKTAQRASRRSTKSNSRTDDYEQKSGEDSSGE